ncbi:MAG: COG3650 family protein [Gemmatimonadota bacterium]
MRRWALLTLLPLCGCGRDAGQADGKAGPDRPAVADTLPTPDAGDARFVAFGNEPFWSIAVDSAGFRFRTPEDTAGVRFAAASPVLSGDSLKWVSSGPQGSLLLVIRRRPCSDGMSDSTWRWESRLEIGGRRLSGCARQ